VLAGRGEIVVSWEVACRVEGLGTCQLEPFGSVGSMERGDELFLECFVEVGVQLPAHILHQLNVLI
jgi:hypothetical protein